MMKKRERALIEYFENNDLGDEMREAERNGNLIITRPGVNPIDAIRRRMAEKKKVPVSMRLQAGVVSKAKARAAVAGVPWTSYIGALIERAVCEPQAQT